MAILMGQSGRPIKRCVTVLFWIFCATLLVVIKLNYGNKPETPKPRLDKRLKESVLVSQDRPWKNYVTASPTKAIKSIAKENVGASKNYIRSRQASQTGYYTCKSEVGSIGYFSDYRAPHYKVKAGWVFNRMTDDYCRCWDNVPLYTPPTKLSEHTKNPCWQHGNSKDNLQCVPFFYLIGFAKCGTTDLYRLLAQHPQVAEPALKEQHWLEYSRFMKTRGSLQFYTKMFQSVSDKISSELIEHGKSKIIFGDGTPDTVSIFYLWRCFQDNDISLTEPTVTNADVIHAINPKAKIIVMVRNPADRLYSHYHAIQPAVPHPLYTTMSEKNFHELCSNAVKEYSRCLETSSAKHCVYNGTLFTKTISHLQESMYSIYLRDWVKVFPKEQILLVRYEEYIIPEIRTETTKKIWEFLELDQLPESEMNTLLNMTAQNQYPLDRKLGPMWDETRKLLDDFYEPFEKDLENLIQEGHFTLVL